jgi:Xaa-Pro aminopeptidase
LFPREMGGGYYHDMTRTWCIGYAPEKIQHIYEQVMTAFDIAVETYALGKPYYPLQEAVLDYFEKHGHATTRSHSNPMTGYVHGLGHGVGLNIHEFPRLHHLSKEDIAQIGNFITIEPGLYYPEDGFGVRVEDSFIVNENGELVSITPFRKDLVLPLKS